MKNSAAQPSDRRSPPPAAPPRSGAQCVTFQRRAMAEARSHRPEAGARGRGIFPIFRFFRFFGFGPAWGPPWPRPGQALCFDNFLAEILLFVILWICCVLSKFVFLFFFVFSGLFWIACFHVCMFTDFLRKSLTPSNDF